ncbi:sporulation-specific diadenylate cyclase CdaS [Virgibacillus sp. NKC19-16]|nr:sporulation-specific diadenylate cyclase CdaS [Virgibacillus sp. NKC19-16]
MIGRLKGSLIQLTEEIDQMIDTIDIEESNVLNKFEQIHHSFHNVQTTTASYYLKLYLSPFTAQYDVLSTAVQHLSERRHGALIVIQRKDELDSLIHSGLPLNADLSYSLMESIFYTGSPLHDGAVLICNDTIISAANVLPLSEHKADGKKLGTRHRAALGLSEQTDALVLVVSEETGRATFALDGKLYPIRTTGVV